MVLESFFQEFFGYYKLLIIGFIGGILVWIFSYTFEDLLKQKDSFWLIFFSSLFLAIIWSFIFAFFSFLILKLFRMDFKKL